MKYKIKDFCNVIDVLNAQFRATQESRKFYEEKFGYDFSNAPGEVEDLYDKICEKEEKYHEIILSLQEIQEDDILSIVDAVNNEVDKINQLGFCFSKVQPKESEWMTSTQECELSYGDEDESWHDSGCSSDDEWNSSDCEIY